MYGYLLACGILGVLWFILYKFRKDIRRRMVWTGAVHALYFILLYFVWLTMAAIVPTSTPMVPSYWNPDSLFNLDRLTGGIGLEDIIFAFTTAGIATALYEFFLRKHATERREYKPHKTALITCAISFIVLIIIFNGTTTFYPFVFSGIIGAIVMFIQRKDIWRHMLFGGASFFLVYFLGFLVFNSILPSFVSSTWSFANISGITLLHVPLEELLWAFTFGLMWSPFYEYENGIRDSN